MRARHSSLWRAPTGWGWGELRRRGASATLALRLAYILCTVFSIVVACPSKKKRVGRCAAHVSDEASLQCIIIRWPLIYYSV